MTLATGERPGGSRVEEPPADGRAGERPAGRRGLVTEFGRISLSDSVVSKIAARAAVEVDDAGAAAPQLLGRDVNMPGLRSTSLDALPKVTAEVDGELAFVALELSVRWPASVRATAEAVRDRVRQRLAELTGLAAREIDIRVVSLVTDLPRPSRVH